jgi:hypothetical protein
MFSQPAGGNSVDIDIESTHDYPGIRAVIARSSAAGQVIG